MRKLYLLWSQNQILQTASGESTETLAVSTVIDLHDSEVTPDNTAEVFESRSLDPFVRAIYPH